MTRIRVKINTPVPAAETIDKYRNFERFMDSYKKYYSTAGIRDMLYKDRKKLVFIVIIILFLMLLLFVDDIPKKEEDKNETPVEQLD